ncbi:MAG: FAD-dependent oxidoreductase [Ureaplasma sp.]|nr:FAD-dependent oxidoreductase [Ureaplasma sp.]MDE7221986.1 FAD-dependent oxidoreductase [Ureaplasma sp.]
MRNFDYESDITIVGAGPAGLTSAIYGCRANLSIIILDKTSPGGKVITTATVENYPGFENITGPDLGLKMFTQAQQLGSKFIFNEVVNIVTTNDYHYVELKNNKVIKTKAVILATGMVNRQIGCPGELNFFHKGISYCAICDGSFHKGLPIAVVGSGLSAVEESIYLSDIGSEIFLISNKSQFKCDQLSINRLKEIKNIKILMNTDTLSFNGKDCLESLTIRDQLTGKEQNINVHGAFIFIGFLPVCPTVNSESILSKNTNFIEVDNNCQTKISGIFAAGDIISKRIRQISTAVGDGTIAALSAIDYINNKNWN